MIKRSNVIELLSDRTNVYHSAVLTCFSFDPIFFESVYLSVLRRLGITNILILMDAGMYDALLADDAYKSHLVNGLGYTLVRMSSKHGGVFHPKMNLLFGADEGALIIGSGNLTFSGFMNNDEIWNAFHIDGNSSANYPLLYNAWEYIQSLMLNPPSLLSKQMTWISKQCQWLEIEPTGQSVLLSSGEKAILLYNSVEESVINRLVTEVSDAKVYSATVIAPFYDVEGNAIKELWQRFNYPEMSCVIDLNRQSAPYGLLHSSEESNISFYKYESTNLLHAKIIELQTSKGTWLLSGSANASKTALGITSIFNEEACILLHNHECKDYITELGLKDCILPLEKKQQKELVQPDKPQKSVSIIKVLITSCEQKYDGVYLRFSKEGIGSKLAFLDKEMNIVLSFDISTTIDYKVDSPNNDIHIAVLYENDVEVSNRCLVVKELNIESCNPDSKQRELLSLLDDPDMLKNLSHILGYIQLDEEKKNNSKKAVISGKETKDKDNDDNVIVSKDSFWDLKDDSMCSLSLHPGVRILRYLQQIFFIKEDSTSSKDGMMEMGKTDDGENNEPIQDFDKVVDNGITMRSDVVSFLNRMGDSLTILSFAASSQGDYSKSLYINVDDYLHKLIVVPKMNAGSSFAVATTAVTCLMHKYGDVINYTKEVRDLLINDSILFISLYGFNIPSEETNIGKKTVFLLKDGSVQLLVALSFFSFEKSSYYLQMALLNIFCVWSKEIKEEIIRLYNEFIDSIHNNLINEETIGVINKIAHIIVNEIPLQEFSCDYDRIFLFKDGYGFFAVDEIKKVQNGWSYHYHHPRYDKIEKCNSASKFKGFIDI